MLGTEASRPHAPLTREASGERADHRRCVLARMDALPARDHAFDLVVAHGIWNHARSAVEFRHAIAEAARVAAPGALLSLFLLSRHTLPPDAAPLHGETFVFTQLSGQPQCFVTRAQLLDELANAGFMPDDSVRLIERNLPPPGRAYAMRGPVTFQAAFRRSVD